LPKTLVARAVDLDIPVSDVHRTDPVGDFSAMAQAGIWGLIHEATQGLGVNDPAMRPGPRMRGRATWKLPPATSTPAG
jgi:hypothetical protein